jgi:hypothetical protein
MRQLSITPSITVAIGRETRLYHAYVTTAPLALDSPNTITLDEGPFSEVIGLARDPIAHDEIRGRMPARLVLVDETQHTEQRAKYVGNLLLPADPWLAGLNALQYRLWLRLQAHDRTVAA